MLSIRQLLTCAFQSLVGKIPQKKGGIKVHTLYDVETQIPAFFHITEASVHDSKVMIEIPYEPSSYYIFDHGYNNFKILYKIHQIEAYFVVRAKKNLNTNPSNGNVGCLRMCFQTQMYF